MFGHHTKMKIVKICKVVDNMAIGLFMVNIRLR